jgi:hypothetical protein
MLANRHLPLLLAALLAVACADRPLGAPSVDPVGGVVAPDDDDLRPCPEEGCDDPCADPPPCGCEDDCAEEECDCTEEECDCTEEECAPPAPRCPENPNDDLCR